MVDLLNRDDDDADAELDDCFFPGSDDGLGFEEVDNEDEIYGTTVTPHSYIEITFANHSYVYWSVKTCTMSPNMQFAYQITVQWWNLISNIF